MTDLCGFCHFVNPIQDQTFTDEFLKIPKSEDIQMSKRIMRTIVGNYMTIPVQSAYLGEVQLQCVDVGRGNVGLLTVLPGLNGGQSIYVKEIDAQSNRLNMNINYPLNYLAALPLIIINPTQCQENAKIIANLKDKPNKTQQQKNRLLNALKYNAVVDCHFNSCNYVTDFLHDDVKINNVINSNLLLSITGFPNYDNAAFTSQYMIYGDGQTLFNPLECMDITGHELGHGIVQSLCNLIYNGHSGALNESFADIFGTCFEFQTYAKYNLDADQKNNLLGFSDWYIGEDGMKASAKYLRNMADPFLSNPSQPKFYRGQYWAPETGADFGGVHTNSGLGNYLFYLIAQALGLQVALNLYIVCLKSMVPTSNYIQFRDVLKTCSVSFNCLPVVQTNLNLVGLTDLAVF